MWLYDPIEGWPTHGRAPDVTAPPGTSERLGELEAAVRWLEERGWRKEKITLRDASAEPLRAQLIVSWSQTDEAMEIL